MMEIPDSITRERAATATDRNIVVTAGAGTGKTTLLVKRLLYLLLRRSAPLTIDRIVALTFTNKAANELKLRLRTELGKEAANELAAKALAGLEKSQIGTIHSFAAHLLRLYPVESGVDPLFQQDEGLLFKDFFNQQWMLWLDRELGPAGARQEVWRPALKIASLEDLNTLATDLAGELIPLDGNLLTEKPGMPPPIVAWLTDLARQATVLRQAHPKTNTLERMMDAAVACLNRMADRGCDEEDRGMLGSSVSIFRSSGISSPAKWVASALRSSSEATFSAARQTSCRVPAGPSSRSNHSIHCWLKNSLNNGPSSC